MAVCDAKQRLLFVDVGSSGRRGDGNVYHNSNFAKKIRRSQFNIPPACNVDGINGTVPFFFVGDAAFQGHPHMLTPFKGEFLPPEKKVFKNRLSRARKSSENVFAMLSQRYELFYGPITVDFPTAKSVIKACCALHNMHLLDTDSAVPCRWRDRSGPFDDYEDGEETVYGRYRHENPELESETLGKLKKEVGEVTDRKNSNSLDMGHLTEELMDYFIENDLPWQWLSAGIVV